MGVHHPNSRGQAEVWESFSPGPVRKSVVAHKWADYLHNPYCMGGPKRFTAQDKISSGPHVGRLATYPLPFGGVPNTLEPGRKSEGPRLGGLAGWATMAK